MSENRDMRLMLEVEERLRKAVSKLEYKKKLQRKLEHAKTTLELEKIRLMNLEEFLAKEEKDVKRLEGLSLPNLFHTILGTKDEAFEKERQEYLAAKLKYDEAKATVQALEDDVSTIARKLDALGDPDRDYRAALREKEEIIRKVGGSAAEELLSMEKEYGRLRAEKKELCDAIDAGEKVQEALLRVDKSLKSAQGWGIWDLLGGGLISTAVKHSRIDEAREHIHLVQQLLHRFKHELADVKDIDLDLQIGGFEKFADYFFDGLIVDWLVQSEINKSLQRTQEQRDRVLRILTNLRERLNRTDQRLQELEENRNRLVESTRM